jgi:hypothetical protein
VGSRGGIVKRDMRHWLAALVVLGLPVVAHAQWAAPVSQTIPLPSIGLPLPRIGLPLAPIGIPRTIDRQPGPPATGPHVRLPGRSDHGRRGGRSGRSSTVYVVPGYAWGFPYYAGPSSPVPSYDVPPRVERDREERSREEKRQTGTLRIDVTIARDSQVFVDGYFAGTLDDVAGELELAPGPHRIELRAGGYKDFAFDVLITAERAITYRGTPEPQAGITTAVPAATAPPAPQRQPGPATVYFIPGCYLGNVPPKDAGLPASCDQSRVTTFDGTGR